MIVFLAIRIVEKGGIWTNKAGMSRLKGWDTRVTIEKGIGLRVREESNRIAERG